MTEILAEATRSHFEAVVGTRFGVLESHGGPEVTSLELVAVQPLAIPHPGRANPFSILLEGDCDPRIPQGTYLLHHPALGDLPLFIVPISEQRGVRQYEAIFN